MTIEHYGAVFMTAVKPLKLHRGRGVWWCGVPGCGWHNRIRLLACARCSTRRVEVRP